MSQNTPCDVIAPVMPGDGGSNWCDRPPGHPGEHSCMPIETPYELRGIGSYRRVWAPHENEHRIGEGQ